MTVIGETLRRERTRRSLRLDQIARQTKISVRLLEAIENEQFDKLPGGVFTKSFVKQYARALGLDDEEIGNELDRLLQPAEEAPRVAPPEPEAPIRLPKVTEWEGGNSHGREGSWLPSLALMVIVMLVCSGVYAWWQRSRHPVPHEAASTTLSSAPAASVETTPPAPATTPAAPMEAKPENPTPETPGTSPTGAQGSATATAAVPKAPEAAPAQAGPIGNPSGSVQVKLRATEPVWVKGWVDGKVMLLATLQANESRILGASDDVKLRVGNAGGLQVELNGKPLGALGPKGQIRYVEFTPKGVELIPLKPPAPPGQPDTL